MVSNATVRNCNFVYNICSNAGTIVGGGGVFVTGGGTLSNCTFFTNISYTCAGGNNYDGGGGAMGLNNGKVFNCTVISNCVIKAGSIFGECGGGVICRSSGDIVSNCFIAYNYVIYGGGVYATAGSVVNCIISNNIATYGGGILPQSVSIVKDCTIVNNSAGEGGGVFTDYGGFVSNCVIFGNKSTGVNGNGGGGICINFSGYTSSPGIIDSCRISNNVCTAGLGGGGVSLRKGGRVRNCLISNNTNLDFRACRGGGGVYLTNASLNSTTSYGLINCTIVNNYSTNEGGGIATFGPSNYIANCVIAGNSSSSNIFPDVYNTEGNSNNYWYCCATGVVFAPNQQWNITNNPMFKDPSAGNWHLSGNSPCVNAGTNQSWMTNSYDLDGRARIRYGTVDMGAYETIYDGTIYKFY